MIDSGSQGNIIKAEVLPHDIKINFLDKIQIKGTSNEILVTVGSTKLRVFNEVIKFHVIRNEIQIPYNGILGVEFLNELNVVMYFHSKTLNFNSQVIPFIQGNNYNYNHEVDRIIIINLHSREQSLPFIDVVNPRLEYAGQFLLDTGSEGNLIKINSLPADCEITSNNCIFLKGVNGD